MAGAETIRNDGAMIAAFQQYSGGLIANHQTGLGTHRDKSTHATVGDLPRLMRHDAHVLFRGSLLIQKIVQLLPQDGVKKWGQISLKESSEQPEFSQHERQLSLRDKIAEAAIEGRLTGDGFVVIGLDDGLLWDEPVDESRISSVRWLKVLNRYDLSPECLSGGYEDPEYYLFNLDRDRWPDDVLPRRIHKSRLVRIPGCKLPADILINTVGYNDSVLMAAFQSFRQYMAGIGSSSSMLQDYSVFVYGLSGLSDMLSNVDEDSAEDARKALLNRFLAIQMGMSSVKGLMIDSENEQANFISRNYGGIDSIIDRLQEALIANSGMPRSKLLGSSNTGAFSEAGKSDRYEWADCISSWQNLYLSKPVEKIYHYLFLAADGPTNGIEPDNWAFEWHDTLQLTRLEQAQLVGTYAKADAISVRTGVLHPMEVRASRYGHAEYGLQITIDDERTAELEESLKRSQQPAKQPATQIEQPQTQAIQARADADTLAQLRRDALDGLLPMKTYWAAMGLDAAEQSKLMDEQQRKTKGYWDADY